jgi:hypothetical protein
LLRQRVEVGSVRRVHRGEAGERRDRRRAKPAERQRKREVAATGKPDQRSVGDAAFGQRRLDRGNLLIKCPNVHGVGSAGLKP